MVRTIRYTVDYFVWCAKGGGMPAVDSETIDLVRATLKKKECSHFRDFSPFWIVLVELAKQGFPIGRHLRVTITTANIYFPGNS